MCEGKLRNSLRVELKQCLNVYMYICICCFVLKNFVNTVYTYLNFIKNSLWMSAESFHKYRLSVSYHSDVQVACER